MIVHTSAMVILLVNMSRRLKAVDLQFATNLCIAILENGMHNML